MTRYLPWIAGAMLVAVPFVYPAPYPLHIAIIILIWSFAYTSWSVMGRFGLTSLGHGGFMGIGAYVTALLWNYGKVTPWIGIPVALVASGLLAVVVAYPCSRFRIVGHYFALVTLALSGIVLQVITATRDYTGGSLGYTPERYQGGSSIYALQFTGKTTWYLIALVVWAGGLYIWHLVDRSMIRYALEAISEDEDAAAAAGVHVTAEKLKITVLSAMLTALAGALYCQYQMFISPDTVSGISISLQMVFAVVVGGIYVSLGPTVGAVITILMAEVLAFPSAPARLAGTISSTASCSCCSSSSCPRASWGPCWTSGALARERCSTPDFTRKESTSSSCGTGRPPRPVDFIRTGVLTCSA